MYLQLEGCSKKGEKMTKKDNEGIFGVIVMFIILIVLFPLAFQALFQAILLGVIIGVAIGLIILFIWWRLGSEDSFSF